MMDELYCNQLDDVRVAWTAMLYEAIEADDLCVHCELLPKGVPHPHDIFGVCEAGKPHTAWFDAGLVKLLIDGWPRREEFPYLVGWSIHPDDRTDKRRLLVKLESDSLDRTYVWRLVDEDSPSRNGFLLGLWVD